MVPASQSPTPEPSPAEPASTEVELAITGMTCAACETTVADAAASIDGIESAKASAKSGLLTVRGSALPPRSVIEHRLVAELKDSPYGLGSRPWVSGERQVWIDVALAVVAVGIVAWVLAATNLADAAANLTFKASTGSTLFVLGLGVAASVSTCMALVGGLVVSLAASAPGRAAARGWERARPHALFNVGRIVGFGLLGALIGLAGQSLSLRGQALGIMLAVVAVVMGLLGLRLTGVSPRLAAWQLSLPSSWGSWARADASAVTEVPPSVWRADARALGLGAASFFLPCGFTQAMQVFALSTGSAWEGGTVMALFALGTTPGLFAAGMAASAAKGKGAARALRYVGVVVVAFAAVTASGAITTALPGLGHEAPLASERTPNVTDEDGWQVVATDVVAQGYLPADSVVYEGEPVRWVLSPEALSCASIIEAQGLGIDHEINVLTTEDVTVEFTPRHTGTFEFHCAMGMYSGTFTVIERPEPAA